MRVPPMGNPTYADFEEYEVVPKTVPLDFTNNDATWVTSNLSVAAGILGAELIKLRD